MGNRVEFKFKNGDRRVTTAACLTHLYSQRRFNYQTLYDPNVKDHPGEKRHLDEIEYCEYSICTPNGRPHPSDSKAVLSYCKLLADSYVNDYLHWRDPVTPVFRFRLTSSRITVMWIVSILRVVEEDMTNVIQFTNWWDSHGEGNGSQALMLFQLSKGQGRGHYVYSPAQVFKNQWDADVYKLLEPVLYPDPEVDMEVRCENDPGQYMRGTPRSALMKAHDIPTSAAYGMNCPVGMDDWLTYLRPGGKG